MMLPRLSVAGDRHIQNNGTSATTLFLESKLYLHLYIICICLCLFAVILSALFDSIAIHKKKRHKKKKTKSRPGNVALANQYGKQ